MKPMLKTSAMEKKEIVEQKVEKIKEEVQKQAEENEKLEVGEKLGVIDKVQEKVVSRKLLVFACATALMVTSNLDPETWGMIAMLYIGSQSVIDAALAWRHGNGS